MRIARTDLPVARTARSIAWTTVSIGRMRMLEGALTGLRVDEEPAIVSLIPLGDPRRWDQWSLLGLLTVV